MRKISDFWLSIILAIGLVSLVSGFLFFVYAAESDSKLMYDIGPLVSILSGVVILYIAIAFCYKTYLLFIGVEVTLCSCYALLLERGVTALRFTDGWPLFVVLTGIALIFSCLYKHKKLIARYFITSLVMIVLGVFFMMFSLHVIKVPLSKFFSVAGPTVMIAFGAAIIIFFFIQGGNKGLVLKEDNSDIDNEE